MKKAYKPKLLLTIFHTVGAASTRIKLILLNYEKDKKAVKLLDQALPEM